MEAQVELTEGEDIQLSGLNLIVTEKNISTDEIEDELLEEQEKIEQGTKIKIEDISIGDVKDENVKSFITNPRALSFVRKAAEYLQIDEGIIHIELYEEAIDGE